MSFIEYLSLCEQVFSFLRSLQEKTTILFLIQQKWGSCTYSVLVEQVLVLTILLVIGNPLVMSLGNLELLQIYWLIALMQISCNIVLHLPRSCLF
jgi:hypothetical protein